MTPGLAEVAKEKLIKVVEVGYDTVEEGVKAHLFKLVREVIVETTKPRNMDSFLMRAIEHLTQSQKFTNA